MEHFCAAAKEPALGKDERFAPNSQRVERRDELVPRVGSDHAATHTAMARHAHEGNVPHSRFGITRLFQQEQITARGMRVTVSDPAGNNVDCWAARSTSPARHYPPHDAAGRGQDTERVLTELWDWIDKTGGVAKERRI